MSKDIMGSKYIMVHQIMGFIDKCTRILGELIYRGSYFFKLHLMRGQIWEYGEPICLNTL